MAGGAGDPAARMRAGAAMVEAGHGAAVVGMAEQRAGPEQLVERERAMEDVAADQTKVCSRSSGLSAWRPMTLALKPGA
jgi:hypothetical protein